ncbi:MAG: segregation/condensation protein A [Gemmatimonadetes bacterium]|nr:MAG: segregation/condensation protein A [Gemmatimonadota bacterium]
MTDTIQAAAPAVPGEGGGGFVVRLDGFSGPLDLLLHLLREQQLEIADIAIATIADQFLKTIDTLGLNEAADYLEMASRLLRLKIQMLLPRHGDEEGWEDPRAELVRRLLEYQQVKEIAVWMEQGIERRAARFGRGYLPPAPEVPQLPVTFEMLELLQAVERVIGGIITPVLHRVVPRPLNVEAATARIEALLRDRPRISWLDSLGANPTLTDVLSTLLALLEMARRGVVRIVQPAPFAPIVIARESTQPTH